MKNTTLHNQNIVKKRVVLLLLLTLTFVLPEQIQAQTEPAVAWAERFGGSFYGAHSSTTASDAFGNVYMTGQFTGPADFGDFTLISTSPTNPDVFVVKTNSSGTVLWAEQFGGSLQDYGVSITTDTSGNVYTAGVFNGTATFGSFIFTADSDYRNIFVVKQNASGEVLWAEKFFCTWTPKPFLPTGIAVDTQGNVYTTVTSGDGAVATFGDITLTPTGTYGDTYIVKQNASGQVLWAEVFGATINNSGNVGGVSSSSITSDVSDNIYITGLFLGEVDFGNTTLTYSSGIGTVFVMKMSPSGEVLWAKHFGEEGTGFSSSSFNITTDTAGNVYVTGDFKGEITVGTETITSAYNNEYKKIVFILKTDSLGEGLWVKGFESTNDSRGYNIVADNFGNVYVTGLFEGVIDFDTITLISTNLYDGFILKTNNLGTVEWAEKFDSTGTNYSRSIALGLAENIYVSGSFSNTITFGDTTLTAIGSNNTFLVKIAMDGNLSVEQNQPEQYKVYPNPVKDILTIEMESNIEANIELFNLFGQKILELGTITDSKNLDLSNLSTGVYLLKVNNNTIKIKKQ